MLYQTVEELIGKTPLLELEAIRQQYGLGARIFGKLEFANPTGSIKDRAALSIIQDAERRGLLQPGGTIVEATSGNTGIGLACIAAARGYRAVIIMPDSMSAERIRLMRAYGAQVELSDGAKGMAGSLEKLAEVKERYPNCVEAGQFANPANPDAHYRTTGPEIWEDLDGQVDVLVAGVGTGGTITGTARFLKEQNPALRVVAVEPAASPLLSEGRSGPHGLQGIGANFVPEVLDMALIDEIIPVADEDAFESTRMLGRLQGVMCGITSGAALWAAMRVAERPEMAGKNVVAILPDSGDRYLSGTLFG